MATEKWIAGSGQGLTWGNAFGAEINAASFNNGNAVLSSVSITNGTALDMFADLSFLAGSTVTTVAPAFLGFYLYPLGQDGSTYGDGNLPTSQAAYTPPQTYLIGNMGFRAAASTTIAGVLLRIIIPPGTFSFGLFNQAGVAIPSSGNVCKYRTYNRSIA